MGAIQMGGDTWKKRLAEICRKLVFEEVGEEETYDYIYGKYKANDEVDAKAFCLEEVRHCQPTRLGPQPPLKATEEAMRSVICQNRCANNAAAYFAATVAALQKSGDAEAAVAPLLLILRRALPAVQASVAGSRLNDVVAALAPALRSQSSDAVVRQALACLTSTAEACYNANGRPNRKVLKPAFALLSDARTTVRRQAELSAVSLLKRAADAKDQQTVDFAVQHLTQMLQSARSDKKASAEEIPAQRAVSLLRAISKLLPDESLGDIFAALTRLPALLGQHPCCSAAFEFAAEHLAPEEQWDDDDEMMPVEADPSKAALAIRFLPGLVEVPITLLNITYVGALAQALAAAVAAVCRAKQAHATKIRATQKILSLFAEQDPGLLRAAREACTTIFQAAGEGGDEAFLQELLEAVRPLLRFEAKGSWCQSLPAVTALFAALGGLRGQLGQSWHA
ncbi:Mzb1 [Symbiodinium sp. CCMP2592]|nr:Mzb1 [Symbiodinium sp. CCMP2592]